MILGITDTPMFYGVVENRNDPMKLGRVQVRIIGLHSDLKSGDIETGTGVSTEDLPWAYPIQPITSPAMNGLGQSPTGIVEGTHVVGFARDGRMMNDLVILGTIGGIPENKSNPQAGFNDPTGTYPKEEYIGEPDTNRLARNENIENTIVKTKNDSLDKGISIANGGAWSEPVSPYNAKYPYNHVSESESGHIIEIDDTAGAERIHEYHRTGTFREVHTDGTVVHKIVGDDYEISLKNKNLHIKGNLSITVDGDASIYVKGNVQEQVDKDVNRVVTGDVTETINGSVTRIIKGSVTETVTGSVTNKSSGYIINGAVNQSGGYIVDGDVVSGGISLENHKHVDTVPGSPSETTKPI